MDAHTFVTNLLPLRGEAVEQFITEHAAEVDDLDAAAAQLKDEARAQENRDVEVSLVIANHLLALAQWTGAPYHRSLGLLARGNCLMRQGHHREAIDCFNTAATDFLAADDEIGWARTRISYLWSASKVGLTEQALEQAEQARKVFLHYGEQRYIPSLEINLALALTGVGRYQEALAAYDRALEIDDASNAQEAAARKARVLTNKANALEMLGDLHGAIRCAEEARTLFAEQGQFLAVANADHNQATLRASLGQYSAALHLYHQARAYYQEHTLSNWAAFTNANMADCLLRLNRIPEALRLAEEAVAIYRTLDEKPDLGWALILLARAHIGSGKAEAALSTLAEAREQFENIGAVATSGLVLLTQAELFLISKQDTGQALTSIHEALTIFRTHQMESWIAEADLLQARAYETAGDLAQAAVLAEAGRKEAQHAQLPWLEFGYEHLLGRLAQRKGEQKAAEIHYQAALALLEGLMTWLVRDQRSTFLADKESVYSSLMSLCLNRQDANGALEYLERMKSQVLREYLTRSADIRLKASDPEEAYLLEELQRLRQELHWYTSQVAVAEQALQGAAPTELALAVRGASTGTNPEQAQQTILHQLKAEQRQRERAISELLERAFLQHERSRFAFFAIANPKQESPTARGTVSVEHLAGLLGERDTLLEYFIQGDDLLIFILHAGHHRAEVTSVPGAASRLSRLLPLFRANIDLVAQQLTTQHAATGLDPALAANAQGLTRRLYDLLLRPVEQHILPDGRLLLVPYGPLHLLPFHALQSEAGYLIEQCQVAYLPAASMLALQETYRPATQGARSREEQALVLGHSRGGQLPYALREAQAVAGLFGARCYLEEQATIERLSGAGSTAGIIHIAAHGQNRDDAPDFSYLQLADGQLSTIDVFNLDLPAELITLSGCETGLVAIGGGDELLGLGRGFLYAGARSLLISLWRVEDASTAQLMERFYHGLLAGRSRAGALRAAQLALLTGAREGKSQAMWQHPYFWAPFRLLGDAGPLVL
jgi:CHAT domain-containing protein/tetratricopeptide (TPR) repeat protein